MDNVIGIKTRKPVQILGETEPTTTVDLEDRARRVQESIKRIEDLCKTLNEKR